MDGGIEAYVRESIGVKRNTKNPEAAYQFIRTWTSEEFYASRDTWGQAYYNSINNRAVEAYLELASEPIVTYREIGGKGIVEEAPGVPKEITEKYMKLLDEITVCYLRSPEMKDVRETLYEYYKGARSYESCISELQSKLEIYVTE